MKKVKLIIASLVLSLTVLSASANNDYNSIEIKPFDSKKELRAQIASLLGKKIAIEITNKESIKASISLMLNKKNELIIISVDSKDTSIDSYIKSKLNYKTIKAKGIKKGTIYKMPLTIKKS